MRADAMWQSYTADHPEAANAGFEAWSYGDAPDELVSLTLAGIKRATASAMPLYAVEGEAIPTAGSYSVLLFSRGEAACVLRTTAVRIVPYCEVSAEFASREGEGDLSLAYWRRVHESFFTRTMAEAGLTFTQDMPVVCEEFEVVFK